MSIKICAIAWKSHLPLLLQAAKTLDWLEIKVFASTRLSDDPLKLEQALKELKSADLAFFYRSTEGFWDVIEKELSGDLNLPVVCIGHDPSLWTLSSTELDVAASCYDYFTLGGQENYTNMLRFVGAKVLGLEISFEPPKQVPWEGFYHPRVKVAHFDELRDYLAWYQADDRPFVGVLLTRHYWASDNLSVEDAVIEALEAQGLNVIPVFSYSVKDQGLGTRSSGQVVQDVFIREDGTCRIDALVKLQPFFWRATPARRIYPTAGTPPPGSSCWKSWMFPSSVPSPPITRPSRNGRPMTRASAPGSPGRWPCPSLKG